MFPTVSVAGSPYERGRQYGEQARNRVRSSIAAYADLFEAVAGWDWGQVTSHARAFVAPIHEFGKGYVDELAGIADGAGVAFEDVLAINVRTEILFSAQVKAALITPAPSECTALAQVRADGRVVAAQNWDWMPFARDTVVVLQAEPDDGPAFVTVVEAGLLSKCGVNTAGVAVMTNALACAEDEGEPGVPYHVLLRAMLGCQSVDEGVGVLARAERASSANYLLADSTGSIVDVEARPGGPERLHRMEPDADGLLVHTNHFVSPDFNSVDYADLVVSTSRFRLQRARELAADAGGTALVAIDRSQAGADRAPGLEKGFAAVLRDHADSPGSICRHPIRSLPMAEQVETVASVLIDLTDRRMQLSEGPPCDSRYEPVEIPMGPKGQRRSRSTPSDASV